MQDPARPGPACLQACKPAAADVCCLGGGGVCVCVLATLAVHGIITGVNRGPASAGASSSSSSAPFYVDELTLRDNINTAISQHQQQQPRTPRGRPGKQAGRRIGGLRRGGAAGWLTGLVS